MNNLKLLCRKATRTSSIARVMLLACLLATAAPPMLAYAVEPVKIGVLTFRQKSQTLEQWRPLAAALKQAMPERNFVVEALAYPELEKAIAARQLDFVLTNSAHYILLTKRSGLSAPLATLAADEQGKAVIVSGGVIFSRAGQAKINSLADLRGKTIAATGTGSVGGYQAQAYELKQAGIHLPQDTKLLITGTPHDNVVEAVLAGRADAGFVHTGALEAMAREGRLDMARLKILNRQNLPGFPAQASTRLYPGWPFAALPHVDENLSRYVAAALFMLEGNTTATHAMNIHGFVIPVDYTPVADMLRELRMPPFDAAPEFTLQDVWGQYRWRITLFVLVGLMLVGSIAILFWNISLRKLVQTRTRNLYESEERIHLLLNSVAEGIYGVDTHGNCTFVNAAFLRILGYQDANEIVGKHIHELIHHSHADGTPYPGEECRMYRSHRRNEKVHVDDEVFWRRDGSSFAVEYWSFPIIRGGQVVGAVATFFDITERKRAESELRTLSTAIEQSPLSVVITDLDAKIQYVNPCFINTTGYSREEVIGQNPRILQSGQTPKETHMELWKTLVNGQVWRGEFINKRKNGELYWEEAHISPVINSAGSTMLYVAVKLEITQRKRAEEARLRAETQFRMVFDDTSDAIVIHNVQGRFLEVNRTMCERLGYSREELLRLSPPDINVPEGAEKFAERGKALMAQGQISFETVHIAKDGRRIPVEINARRIDYAGGPATLSVVRDITERKKIEEELKRSNAELEQFSYAVSHDMRQPLRMISSYLQLIEMGLADQLDSEKRSYFNFAIEGAKRIDQMLVALLEYSRVGRVGEPPVWIESRAVLDEALQFLRPALADAQARLNITGDWPRISARHDEILRLLQNLIGNAAKYRIAGRIPEITVTSEMVKNEWRLCVADNGVGLIPEQIKRLFQVFQRLQSRAAYEGTGIGLALCRKIAEHHKGRIWAESAGEGQGSKFCVVLPVPREETISAKGITA